MSNGEDMKAVQIAVLTVSDTRTFENDKSGDTLVGFIEGAGHIVQDRKIIKDEVDTLVNVFNDWIADPDVDVIISTGGTGVTGRDVTPEAVKKVIDVDIPGFGELFRMLSFQKIGPSTIQSRAVAGRAKGTLLFAVPGSTGACKDAWNDILAHQLDSRTTPCNFVTLMPRFTET